MKTFVIAECGINANGNVELAKQQIDLAVMAGASAVKFQVYDAERLHGKNSPVFKDALRGQFNHKDFRVLADYSPIEWFATPFDNEAVELLEDIGVKRYKIASRSVNEINLLKIVNKTRKPVLLSTGNFSVEDVRKALDAVKDCKVTLMYCVPSYPTKIEELNFGRMVKMAEMFHLGYGFSDHTQGVFASLEAVRLGAEVIEKHFTVSRTLEGCDQPCSLEPLELKLLVKSIRQYEIYRNDVIN